MHDISDEFHKQCPLNDDEMIIEPCIGHYLEVSFQGQDRRLYLNTKQLSVGGIFIEVSCICGNIVLEKGIH